MQIVPQCDSRPGNSYLGNLELQGSMSVLVQMETKSTIYVAACTQSTDTDASESLKQRFNCAFNTPELLTNCHMF